MWKQEENKDAYASENGVQSESWWSKTSAPGEQLDSLLTEYLQSTEGGSEGKAIAEDQTGSLRAEFEHTHSISSHIPPQVPGIEITMSEDHPTASWPRQEEYETGGTPDTLDSGSDGLKFFRDDHDVAREVGDDGCVSQTQDNGGQRGVERSHSRASIGSSASGRHYHSDAQKDEELERTLSPLDSTADLKKPDQLQLSASPVPGSLVKPELPNKQASPSPTPLTTSSPIAPHHQPQSLPHAPTLPSSSPSITRLKSGYLTNSITRRSLSAVQQYRLLDERQAKRTPLWRRRVNYKSSLSDTEEMLATARTQAYGISSPAPMADSLRYQAHLEPTHFLNTREHSATEAGDLFPLSPPLSSARSSFLCPNNNVAPHINGNYNLSSESLPTNAEANGINLLSRPQSMPQLQEPMENPYSTSQNRQYLHHSPSHEYLSPGASYDESMMKSQQPLSGYSSFDAPLPVGDPLDLEAAEDSSSSAPGSSPQAWWGQAANLELAQDGAAMIYPATSTPAATPSTFTSLPNMSPKRRFNQTPSSDNLHNQLLMLQHQQQPRSPMLEQDRIYAYMQGQQSQSAMPSPPGSPSYYFGSQITSDNFSPVTPTGVTFIDPFHNSGHHQPQPQQYNTFPRRNPLPKSMLGFDAQSSAPIPIRTVPSHAGHNGITRSQYLRKTGSLGRSSRMPPMGKNDPKEVSFVNFTPHDATKILSGVAPSGSSKTKARREREAQEKRRKLSEAATAAILTAGGDPSAIENIDF